MTTRTLASLLVSLSLALALSVLLALAVLGAALVVRHGPALTPPVAAGLVLANCVLAFRWAARD